MVNDKIVRVAKINYTVTDFAEKFCNGDRDQALNVLEVLVQQGKASWIEFNPNPKEDALLRGAINDQAIINQAETFDTYDELQKQFALNQKRSGRLTYDKVEFDFPHLGMAQEFQRFTANELCLETEIAIADNGMAVLRVFNLTDNDLNIISRKYNRDNIVQKTVGVVDKTGRTLTGAVDYTATKVVAPTAQVVAKSGVSIGKTVVKTGIKTLGAFTSALFAGTRECASEIKNDADVVRAGRDLIETKHAISRGITSMGSKNSVGNGIHIYR